MCQVPYVLNLIETSPICEARNSQLLAQAHMASNSILYKGQ